MREYETTFKEGLKRGLRRFDTNPNNEEWLVECHNLEPMEDGLRAHETITLIGAAEDFFLLTESGDYILTEDGDRIII